MYFFSGENTCLNVMPACLDISVKCGSLALVKYQRLLSFAFRSRVCRNNIKPLYDLCVLCVSVVSVSLGEFTTETQRTQRMHRERPMSFMVHKIQPCLLVIIGSDFDSEVVWRSRSGSSLQSCVQRQGMPDPVGNGPQDFRAPAWTRVPNCQLRQLCRRS